MRIKDLLNPNCIKLNGSAKDKADAIEHQPFVVLYPKRSLH